MTIDEFLAIFTQLNLINPDRHMKMQMLEFLEAITRCADVLSLPPPGSIEEEWPSEKKSSQLLVKKIEHLLYILIKLSKKEFINKYVWPGRDMWGLFTVQKSNGNTDN
jgi:hypothetical protein